MRINNYQEPINSRAVSKSLDDAPTQVNLSRNDEPEIKHSHNYLKIFSRINFIHLIIFAFFSVALIKLYIVQVRDRQYYTTLADQSQEKRWVLRASRGTIYGKDRDNNSPLALNITKYNLIANPKLLKEGDDEKLAKTLIAAVPNLIKSDIIEGISDKKLEYSIIGKRLTQDEASKILNLHLEGIDFEVIPQRAYPEGKLASQVLGFVNENGEGQYGIEQYLNQTIGGKNGSLKSRSTVSGAPILLPGQADTVEIPAIEGQDVVLSLDVNLQKKVEEIIEAQSKESQADGVSALIMNANNGQILSMANYPSYDPNNYVKEVDASLFQNKNITDATEVGSIIKVLTMTTGIDQKVITKDSVYNNTNAVMIDGYRVANAYQGHPGTTSMVDVLSLSLNTGVIHVLEQLGGGSINQKGKSLLFDYDINKYMLGAKTGVEQAGESPGVIFSPTDQEGSDVRYSNMTFGQGLTITPIQAASALSAIVNGGTYYQPTLVDTLNDKKQEPKVVSEKIINKETTDTIKEMMFEASTIAKYTLTREGYKIGAKTGTSQVADANGGYSKDGKRGTCFGFVESKNGLFVIMVKVENPHNDGFAGGQTAAPAFRNIADWLIDYKGLKPLQ